MPKELIAIIDDEPDILELVSIHLKRAHYNVREFAEAEPFYRFLALGVAGDYLGSGNRRDHPESPLHEDSPLADRRDLCGDGLAMCAGAAGDDRTHPRRWFNLAARRRYFLYRGRSHLQYQGFQFLSG